MALTAVKPALVEREGRLNPETIRSARFVRTIKRRVNESLGFFGDDHQGRTYRFAGFGSRLVTETENRSGELLMSGEWFQKGFTPVEGGTIGLGKNKEDIALLVERYFGWTGYNRLILAAAINRRGSGFKIETTDIGIWEEIKPNGQIRIIE